MRFQDVASTLILTLLRIGAVFSCVATGPGTTPTPTTTTTTAPAACTMCPQNIPMVVMDNQGAKAFQSRTFGTAVNGCATQTFVCASNGAASIPEIEFNSGADGVQDGPAGGTTTAVLECNAAGTAWVFRGSNINTIECDAT